MRLSRSVINNLCVLSLVGSVVDQMATRRDQYPPELCALHDELRVAHDGYHSLLYSMADIDTESSNVEELLADPGFNRWRKKEEKFFDTVIKAVPERTLDARMWLTAVMLVVEEYVATIPEHAKLHREQWDALSSIMASIYALYDPGFRCRKMMRKGMDKGVKILEVLK